MKAIGVDPAFSDSKTKKTSIVRNMSVRDDEKNGLVFLDIVFSANEEEANSLRTCVSSFVANLSLVCETMKEFGN